MQRQLQLVAHQTVDYQVVHAIPGRLRLKVPGIRQNTAHADRLELALRTVPGVTTVRVNSASESIVVSYRGKAGNRGKSHLEIEHQLIQSIERAGNGAIAPAFVPPAPLPEAIAEPPPVSAVASTHQDEPVAAEAAKPAHTVPPQDEPVAAEAAKPAHTVPPQDEPVAAEAAKPAHAVLPQIAWLTPDVSDLFDTLGIPESEESASGFNEFPLEIDQENKVLRLGVPAGMLLHILNAELDKFEAENEKHTDSERIHLDLDLALAEAGLILQGKAKGKFRKKLFTVPLVKRKQYTPWVTVSAVGQAALTVSMVDEVLHVDINDLEVSGEPGEWHEELIKYSFEYLFKDRLMTRINETLSNYSGENLQDLFFQTKGGQKFLGKLQKLGLSRAHINALLGLFKVNASLATDYLWLSIHF